MQSAQLPAIKEVRPEYRDLNAQVLQDVLHRLDTAFAAFCRRLRAGAHPATRVFRERTAITASPIRRSAHMVGMVAR